MRALIVDDSRTIRQILRRILEPAGFEVVEASSAEEALAHLDASPVPEVGLIDWDMPGMDGIALVRAIREAPTSARMRIVMVTKRTGLDHIVAAREAGADEYLEKPFSGDSLREKLVLVGLAV